MKKYLTDYNLSDLVRVDDRFQNSINIQLDLNKKDKVLSYIPTKSSTKILNRYLNNVVNDTKEKATLLIGPYGKGKSHLLLVLSAILSMGEENEGIITEITERIKAVDLDTAENINVIRNKKKKFLPVIISNTQMDLNQAYLLALNEALKKNGLTNIQPNTYYVEALNVIENWEAKYPNTYKELKKILKEEKLSVTQLKIALKMCDKTALEQFKVIYPNLTAGSLFNPLINTDMLHLFQDINNVICNEYGYSGMFIIFDEFSKYIEGHDVDTIASDMKVLQDMCELANDSKENQIHTLFVAHKSIKEYNNVLPKELINSFRGIEGRLKEILFITSSQNNYELIQNAIIKTKAFNDYILANGISSVQDEAVYEIPAFKTLFTPKDFERIVVKGCFPLTSVAAYLLLGISEKVAQNERTLFTFISKDEPYSMARIIREHRAGTECYITADNIYDYFKNIFKAEVNNPLVHGEWLKADYALKHIKGGNEKKIIKSLAILNIINRKDEIPPNKKYLQISSGLMPDEMVKCLINLENRNIIEYRSSNGLYYFKNRIGIELDRELKRVINRFTGKINYIDALTKLSDINYILPKIHNQKKYIKRYFESIFMLYEDFMNLETCSALFDYRFSDGKVVYLISLDTIDLSKCKEQIQKLGDPRIVVIPSNGKFDKLEKLYQYLALEELRENKAFTTDNKVLIEEIEIYEEEIRYEVQKHLECLFDLKKSKTCILHYLFGDDAMKIKSSKELNRFISNICDEIYCNTPIINNEMINKNHISSQIKTARNSLVDKIVNREDLSHLYEGTAPEASIFRSTLVYSGIASNEFGINLGLELVMQEIKSFVLSSEENRHSFKELYKRLLSAPYGMRRGTIPIYIAFALRYIDGTPIIYIGDKEVTLNAEVLSNLNEKPEDFTLYIEKGTKEKVEYLDNLFVLFDKYSKIQDNGLNRMTQIVYRMQRWMQSLSNVASNFKYNLEMIEMTEQEFEGLKSLRKKLKKVECNPRDLLFEQVLTMFDTTSLSECYQKIELVKKETDLYIIKLKDKVIQNTKDIFIKNSVEDLGTVLKSWYSEQSSSAKNTLVSTRFSSFMNFIADLDTFDEKDIVNKISKIILDIHIENWGDNSFEEFTKELSQLKKEIELTVDNKENIESKNKIVLKTEAGEVERYYDDTLDDSTCYFLRNELENALEEFGETLEVNQKVSVLVQLINELIM